MSKKRILLVGASGIIGKAVNQLLSPDYEVIRASRKGEVQIDLTDPEGMVAVLKGLAPLDHIISTAGYANFVPLDKVPVAKLEDSPYKLGLLDKLMGQVNLALAARDVLVDKGSVTLTSGTTSEEPIIGGSSFSMVNGALEKWALAAATEMPRGIRVNVVSPSVAAECSPQHLAAFPGFEPLPAFKMALAYKRCVDSLITGRTIAV